MTLYVPPSLQPLENSLIGHFSHALMLEPNTYSNPSISLHNFVRQAWHVVEPATPFIDGWHIGAICEHLEAVMAGEIRHLVICMPPRHAKSLVVSVMWPVWTWTFRPSFRWLFSSYSAGLSIRDSLKSRRIIQSLWYQSHYGKVFKLTGDQNAKARFENDKTGYRLATSVGGAATGEGASGVVVDDPHHVMQVESDTKREAVLEWWDQAMSTRLNDPKKDHKIIIQQRVHENDLAGHVMESGDYEILKLPAEYELNEYITCIGWQDPRTKEGELLWPQRVGPTEIEGAKRTLGSYGYAGQYQQNPVPREGGMFKKSWWRYYKTLPRLARVEQYIDSAFKTGVENDYSAIATWGMNGLGDYFLIDFWMDRKTYPELMQRIHLEHKKWRHLGQVVPIIIEDKASGQSALQTLRQPMPTIEGLILPALPVIPFPAPGIESEKEIAKLSKAARAEGTTPLVQAGQVWLPSPLNHDIPWLDQWLDDHEKFPVAKHDDDVDTTSMALTRLKRITESIQMRQRMQQESDVPRSHGGTRWAGGTMLPQDKRGR